MLPSFPFCLLPLDLQHIFMLFFLYISSGWYSVILIPIVSCSLMSCNSWKIWVIRQCYLLEVQIGIFNFKMHWVKNGRIGIFLFSLNERDVSIRMIPFSKRTFADLSTYLLNLAMDPCYFSTLAAFMVKGK